MPAWPDYARVMMDGYSEDRDPAIVVTAQDRGPPKHRRRVSRVMRRASFTVGFFSEGEYAAFLAWFDADTDSGAAWFDWRNPLTSGVVSARIAGGVLGAAALIPSKPGRRQIRLPITLEWWSA